MIKQKFLGKKDKKGDVQQLQFFIMYMVFAIIIFVFLIYFVHNSLTTEGLKSKILAKEVALLIDSAKPGTEISIDTEGFAVSLDEKNKEIVVQAEKKPTSYSYNYFSLNKIELSKKETEILIKIS